MKKIDPKADPLRALRWHIAAAVTGTYEGELYEILLRRAYNWRVLGRILPTGPDDVSGQKAQRRYRQHLLPLFAVLLAISNIIEDTLVVDQVSTALQKRLARDRRFIGAWQKAFAEPSEGEGSPHRLLTISLPNLTNDGVGVRIGTTVDIKIGVDTQGVFLDLDDIFFAAKLALEGLGTARDTQGSGGPEDEGPEPEMQAAAE